MVTNKKASIYLAAYGLGRRLFRGTRLQSFAPVVWLQSRVAMSLVPSPSRQGQDVEIEYMNAYFLVSKTDWTIVPSLASGEYEQDEVRAFLDIVGRDTDVVDVGANIGVFTVLAAVQSEGASRVLAIEANPVAVVYLEKNIVRNGIPIQKVIVENVAVGKPDAVGIWKDTGCLGTNHFELQSERNEPSGEAGAVQLNSLSALIQKHGLRLNNLAVKVDIEGMEVYVLQDLEELIERYQPALLFEVCTDLPNSPRDVWDEVINILDRNYSQIDVFSAGTRTRANDIRGELGLVVQSGRLHNVLLT